MADPGVWVGGWHSEWVSEWVSGQWVIVSSEGPCFGVIWGGG